ncbi:MAG: hypothetical protein ABIQ39_02145 [Ilumatobacteraceae bacterium]
MDVSLNVQESDAVSKALRSYVSDLRMEIVDTDNPEYKRELREEQNALEAAIGKLDAAVPAPTEDGNTEAAEARVITLWWRRTELT